LVAAGFTISWLCSNFSVIPSFVLDCKFNWLHSIHFDPLVYSIWPYLVWYHCCTQSSRWFWIFWSCDAL
jgi:hypothetical protein